MPLNFSPQLISIVVQCTTSTRPWYIGSKSDRNRKAEQAMRPGPVRPSYSRPGQPSRDQSRAEQTNCRPGHSRKLLLPLSSSPLSLSLAQHLSSCRFGQQLRDQFVLDGGYHKFKHDRQWSEWEGPSCFGRFFFLLLLCHVYYTRPWKTWNGGGIFSRISNGIFIDFLWVFLSSTSRVAAMVWQHLMVLSEFVE